MSGTILFVVVSEITLVVIEGTFKCLQYVHHTMQNETISMADRIERARTEELVVDVVTMDPLVVNVHNETSDRVHTTVPDSLHCSCEDHQYRNTICKHLVFLADSDDWIAEAVRQQMTDKLKSLQEREMALRDQLESIAEDREQIDAVRSELDVVLDYSEDVSADNEGSFDSDWQGNTFEGMVEVAEEEPEEAGFASMVRDLTSR